MEFYNFNNQLQRPFAVYADFKCSRITADEPGILQKHEPNSAAVRFVNTFGPSINQTWSYVGKDCVSKLITELNKLAQECIIEMQKHTKYEKHMKKQIQLKKKQFVVFFVKFFTKQNYKVTDHCHRTGEYRWAAYNMCNINFFSNRYLLVFFHDLKGCDGHSIIREAF